MFLFDSCPMHQGAHRIHFRAGFRCFYKVCDKCGYAERIDVKGKSFREIRSFVRWMNSLCAKR